MSFRSNARNRFAFGLLGRRQPARKCSSSQRRKRLRLESLEDRRLLAVWTVNSTLDTADANLGDGVAADAAGNVTLRAAIMEANAWDGGGPDTINVPAGTYQLHLTGAATDSDAINDIDISDDLIIVGAGADVTTINAGGLAGLRDRIFEIDGSSTVEISGLTFSGGYVSYGEFNKGGAIKIGFNSTVDISDSKFINNQVFGIGLGGAIDSNGVLTIENSHFEDNYARNTGGAVNSSGNTGSGAENQFDVMATIRDSTFISNTAGNGGAVGSHAVLVIDGSTFSGNVATSNGQGGAIELQGSIFSSLAMTNSTVSGNTGRYGGGIHSSLRSTTSAYHSLSINSSTIANNHAEVTGGGISMGLSVGPGISNTIIANNTSSGGLGPDVRGTAVSSGNNLISDSSDSLGWVGSDLVNVDPLLLPLGDYGGFTQTHALSLGSPAIDAANTTTSPGMDQRGVARPQGESADIGAYELSLTNNQPPDAADDAATTAEETAVTVDVLANDSDFDGDVLSVASFTDPTHGTLVLNADDTFTYTPNENYFGPDSFTYIASDGAVGSTPAVVDITVTAVNDLPVVSDARFTISENRADGRYVGTIAATDDADADANLSFQLIGSDAAPFQIADTGVITVAQSQLLDYETSPAFSFSVSVTDADGGTATANVQVELRDVLDESVSPGEVWSQKGGDAGHDFYVSTDVNPSTISELWYTPIALAQTPLHYFTERGVAVDGDRIYRVALEGRVDSGTAHLYAFDLDTGTQEWTAPFSLYTYDAISEPVVDNGLVYINRGGHSSSGGTPDPTLYALNAATGTIARTTNYAAQWGSKDQPTVANGQLFVEDGYYGGISGYNSTTLSEIWNASGPQLQLPESAVNEEYVFAYGSSIYPRGTGTPVQSIQTLTGMTSAQAPIVDEDGNVLYTGGTGSGFVTLVDGHTLEILWETMPTSQEVPTAKAIGGGRVAVSLSSGVEFLDQTTGNGLGSWNVPTGYRGPGQVVLTDEVAFVVAPQDYSSTSQQVTWTTFAVDLATMTTVWTHDQVQLGTYGAVELAVVNDRLITSAWNGIHVFSIGGVANDDIAATTENTQVVIDVLANDGTGGGSWQISSVSDPANGTAQIANGLVTYTPDTSFIGSDGFTYTIDNGNGGTDTATVNVTVAANLDPQANDDSATTDEDTSVTISVLANDTDTVGDVLSVASVTDPANGTAVVNADGTVTYSPDLDFHGSDSFAYTVSDDNGGSATATVELTVNSVNDDPDAFDDAFSVNEDQTLIVSSINAVAPVLHYNFDESSSGAVPAQDSGTLPAADGTLFGLATRTGNTPAGISSGALDLAQGADSSNYVSDNDAQKIDDLTQMTATFWLNLRDNPQAGDVLLSDLTAYPAPEFTTGWELRIAGPTTGTAPTADNFRLEFETGYIGTSSGSAQAGSKGPFSADGQWAFVAITFSSTGLFQWYSGSEVAEPSLLGQTTFAYPLSNLNNLVDMRIGGSPETPDVDRTPPAWIDDVRIYDRVLNAAEIDDARLANLSSSSGGGVLANDLDVDGNALTSSLLTGPSNGTLTLNPDGSFEYSPDANFSGIDSFSYTTSDGMGGTDTAVVTITVNSVQDDPQANNDSATTDEDTPVTINVLTNDSDVDGDNLTVTAGEPANGTTTVNANGSVTYTPDPNFNGADSFTYTVSDGNGGSATATVNVTVDAVNDDPSANDDFAATDEDTPVTIDVLGNDSDLDGDGLSVTSVGLAANGTTTVNADGTVMYTPAPDFNGTDSFTYTVSDGSGGSATATIDVIVNAVNDDPQAGNDSATTDEDTPVTIYVLANDSDVDGDSLSVTAGDPANGTTAVNADGTVAYTPAPDFNGTDSFTYTVSDANGSSDTATVNVTVNAVNDDPQAGNDSATTDEDTPVTINVLANDSDVDGDSLSVTAGDPANGTTAVNADGTVTYTPDPNFNGTDSFTYTVSDGSGGSATATIDVTVQPVNDAPSANDDFASTDEDTPVTIGVLGNDSDVDGDGLTVTSVGVAASGTALINADGTVAYTPAPDFNGTDSFTYTVSDVNGGSATARVDVTVNAVNDDPQAGNDSATTDEDTPVTIDVLGNDSDVDGDSLTVTAGDPANGTTTVNADGTVTYTPDPNFNGIDSFSYTVSDGSGGSATATIDVTVQPVNDDPSANDDFASTDEDTPVTIGVLGNDSDVDGDGLTVSSVGVAASGTALINADGSVTYTPNPNFNGTDGFTYTVSDGNGGSATARVDVTVNAVNDDPQAGNDSATTDEDTPVTINVLANDSDVDGDSLSVTAGDPANGTTTVNANGTVTYTPDPNFNGSDSFTYTIDDGNGGTSSSTVAVAVLAVNELHVGDLDGTRTIKGKSGKWEAFVTATIHDYNDQPVAGAVVNGHWSGAKSGTISGTSAADGTVTFATGNLATGNSVTFTVESVSGDLPYDSAGNHDVDGDSNGTAITVSRTNTTNEPPVAGNDLASTPKNTALTVHVLANDSDSNNDPLTVQSVAEPPNGSVVINTDNTLTYTPNPDFIGSDSFEYTINDGNGLTDSAIVTVMVQDDASAVIAHVGDLDARTNVKGKSGKWEAIVTATIHDATDQAVGGVTVVGQWSGAISGSASGTTAADGTVVFASGNITSTGSVTLSIINVSGGVNYGSSANHDPDGDSDGSSISINQGGATNLAVPALWVSDDEELQVNETTTAESTVSAGKKSNVKKSADGASSSSRSSRWNIQLVDQVFSERETGEHPWAGLVDDLWKWLPVSTTWHRPAALPGQQDRPA